MSKFEVYYEGNLRTRCEDSSRQLELKTDGPKELAGKGELFSPTDLVAVALGTCVLTLMGMEATKLKVDLTGLRLTVEKGMATAPSRRIGNLKVHVYCPHSFTSEIQQKLEIAGSKCPVHQSLHPDIKQEFFFHWGEA